MSISERTRKMLWGRSANRCARCRRELIEDSVGLDDSTIIGKEAHIRGQSTGGPRFDANLADKLVDGFDNLILLCGNCHDIVDSQVNTYTVEALRKMKAEHHAWVDEQLGPEDRQARAAAETLASYIDK